MVRRRDLMVQKTKSPPRQMNLFLNSISELRQKKTDEEGKKSGLSKRNDKISDTTGPLFIIGEDDSISNALESIYFKDEKP